MNTLRKKREAQGWSIKDLAERAGVSVASVCHWENEKKHPRPSKKRKLAEVFKCSIQELFPNGSEYSFLEVYDHFPQWLAQAWDQRFVCELYGWFDPARLRHSLMRGLQLQDCIASESPLKIIIIPTNRIMDAPLLFKQEPNESWTETPMFFDFEQHMAKILERKHILRNDILYHPHHEGVALQPAMWKERQFVRIAQKLMEGRFLLREKIDLRFHAA